MMVPPLYGVVSQLISTTLKELKYSSSPTRHHVMLARSADWKQQGTCRDQELAFSLPADASVTSVASSYVQDSINSGG